MQQDPDPIRAHGRTGIGDVKVLAVQDDCDTGILNTFGLLMGFQDGIGSVLYQFQNLSVAVTARQHGFFDPGMLLYVGRRDAIGFQPTPETVFNQLGNDVHCLVSSINAFSH
ncbi:MAG: hypothetical protein J0L95_03725 [Candidatus Accumulibacter sp.]|nr:hypothetical protein [Accumulibacter sp.]